MHLKNMTKFKDFMKKTLLSDKVRFFSVESKGRQDRGGGTSEREREREKERDRDRDRERMR